METKWKDVVGMYLGCEVMVLAGSESKESNIKKLVGIHTDYTDTTWYHLCDNEHIRKVEMGYFKPLLRTLSDITQDEVIEWAKVGNYDLSKEGNVSEIHSQMVKGIKQKGINFFKVNDGEFELVPHFILFCLKRSFDIFGLIDSGQAINRTTQPSLTNNK